MNRFFRRLPLLAKLMLIGMIPLSFLIVLTFQVYDEKTQKLSLFKNYKEYLAESANISRLIDALQEERKFSFDYAMTKGMWEELVLQRPITDSLIQLLEATNDPVIEGFTGYTKLGMLQEIRNKIDTFGISPNDVMHFYSNTIFRLNTLNTIPPANTAYLKPVYKDLIAQKILSEMITYLGIIRSNIYNVLYTRKYMIETMYGTFGTYDVFHSYEAELQNKAPRDVRDQYNKVRTATAYKPTIVYIDTLFKKFSFDSSYSAAAWWKVSDEGTDALRNLQAGIWTDLNKKINDLYNKEKSLRDQTVVLLITALLSVILILTYIVFIISRTLKELRMAAERISRGETGVFIKAESNDVIGSLAKSISDIDKNSFALAHAATEIGKGNFSVEVKPRSDYDMLGNAVVEMKKELEEHNRLMEQRVAERTEELARSNEDLQQFAHVASHDLKEPLRKIATFISILVEEQKDNLSDKGKIYLEKISNAAQRMSTMIEGVLAYSTVSVQDHHFEVVDLNKVIEGVESDLELAIIQKEAVITYQNLPFVKGIPLLLQQLFYNLLNNGIKFSKSGEPPVIKISSVVNEKIVHGKTTRYYHITIEDNGIGFDPMFAERMFNVFFRLNSKDKYEGTGLGLALCKKIVLRHKGDIYAEGDEGKGARFHIFLPA